MPDPPHVLKNIRALFCGDKSISKQPQDIILPNWFVAAKGLTSTRATMEHIELLMEAQGKPGLKLATKLSERVIHPTNFDKMSVAGARALFSKPVVDGLIYLVKEEGYSSDLLTTAAFVDVVSKWFDLVSSREIRRALSRKREDKFKEAIAFLEEIIKLFHDITFDKGGWKPIQTGVIMSTKTLMNLAYFLLDVRGLSFFMTSRMSQDSLENLFSMVRSKNPVPTAKEFKYNLRAITISQYLKEHTNSNYDFAGDTDLADFFDSDTLNALNLDRQSENAEAQKDFFPHSTLNQEPKELAKMTHNILYYVAGNVIKAVKKRHTTCGSCLPSIEWVGETTSENASAGLQSIKDMTGHSLVQCPNNLFQNFFVPAEKHFLNLADDLAKTSGKNVLQCLVESFQPQTTIPDCHKLSQNLASQFFRTRLHAFAKDIRGCQSSKKKGERNSSKSIEMRHRVNSLQ